MHTTFPPFFFSREDLKKTSTTVVGGGFNPFEKNSQNGNLNQIGMHMFICISCHQPKKTSLFPCPQNQRWTQRLWRTSQAMLRSPFPPVTRKMTFQDTINPTYGRRGGPVGKHPHLHPCTRNPMFWGVNRSPFSEFKGGYTFTHSYIHTFPWSFTRDFFLGKKVEDFGASIVSENFGEKELKEDTKSLHLKRWAANPKGFAPVPDIWTIRGLVVVE